MSQKKPDPRALTGFHREGNGVWNMSLALRELGDKAEAIFHAEEALKIREEIGDPRAAKVRQFLEEWGKEGPRGPGKSKQPPCGG